MCIRDRPLPALTARTKKENLRRTVSLMNGCGRTESAAYRTATTQMCIRDRTGITQNVKDLLSSREVENIFENSDFVYMLNQAGGHKSGRGRCPPGAAIPPA